MKPISLERAERIARAHPCDNCGEYNFKKLRVSPGTPANLKALGEVWHVTKVCGVCGMHHEMGIDAEGDIVYSA